MTEKFEVIVQEGKYIYKDKEFFTYYSFRNFIISSLPIDIKLKDLCFSKSNGDSYFIVSYEN